jgi:membrane-bound serine protease (ClpP class)
LWFLALLFCAILAGPAADTEQSGRLAVVLTVRDAIGPAIGDYLKRGLRQAAERGAGVVVIQLDTPGGLDTAMRDINRAIIASPIPVVMYVAPAGARAASAGTYMLYAAHIAAMAPGTNVGAATPIQFGGEPGWLPEEPEEPTPRGKKSEKTKAEKDKSAVLDTMSRKMINDAVAYIRSLAEMRGRNADWAEQAVREAASLSAEDAKLLGVIDIIAADVPALLATLDGYHVEVNDQSVMLNTADIRIETIVPDWRTELLAVITNPNIVYLLMLIGFWGLVFEITHPGYVLPGVAGAICLILALYALQVLPVNYAGLALILLGLVFMIAEVFVPSFGALGIGGLISFIVGSVILFDVEGADYAVSWWLIGMTAALSAMFLIFALGLLIRSHRRPVVTGAEEIIGSTGFALEDFSGSGRVRVHGEIWTGRADRPLRAGQPVRVIARAGLILKVEPYEQEGK